MLIIQRQEQGKREEKPEYTLKEASMNSVVCRASRGYMRSISGKHLSFSSNLSLVHHRSDRQQLGRCISFNTRISNEEEGDNESMLSGGGFEYAMERMKRRQMFLRSYHLSVVKPTNRPQKKKKNAKKMSVKQRFLALKTVLLAVFACSSIPRTHSFRRLNKSHSFLL